MDKNMFDVELKKAQQVLSQVSILFIPKVFPMDSKYLVVVHRILSGKADQVTESQMARFMKDVERVEKILSTGHSGGGCGGSCGGSGGGCCGGGGSGGGCCGGKKPNPDAGC